MQAYDQLLKEYEEVSVADSIRSVLSWDIETGKMPPLGLKHRSKQFSYLSQKIQDFWKSPHIGQLVADSAKEELGDVQKRNLRLIERIYEVQNGMPRDLLMARSAQATTTNEVWKKAKAAINYEMVSGEVQKLFELNQEYATKLGEIKNIDHPFDALIDTRDEGLTSEVIAKHFGNIKGFLIDFIKNYGKDEDYDHEIRAVHLSRREEQLLAELIAQKYKYTIFGDQAHGTIDEVEHPLTITCGPLDVRITIKYGDYLKVMNSTHHELGHAIHKLGKRAEWNYTPLNDMGGPTMGECISRYTENKIGKSYEFMVDFFDEINDLADFRFNSLGLDEFYNQANTVRPTTSRMTSDEVSYGMHIIIRFELEKMLFEDQLTMKELPIAWNQKYDDYLGIEVPNDTVGVMQDLHWYSNYWGYFHGYFMGDLIGSQFHATMQDQVPDYAEELCGGNLAPVLSWLQENLFAKGNYYPALDHLEAITGSSLDTKYFKDYITKKYNPI